MEFTECMHEKLNQQLNTQSESQSLCLPVQLKNIFEPFETENHTFGLWPDFDEIPPGMQKLKVICNTKLFAMSNIINLFRRKTPSTGWEKKLLIIMLRNRKVANLDFFE